MKLRKPCEHGRYDAHPVTSNEWPGWRGCPGGEEPNTSELVAALYTAIFNPEEVDTTDATL